MLLGLDDIHIWSVDLAIPPAKEKELLTLLSTDEKLRAQRFRFPLHRRRFIAARGALRQLLSEYLHSSPEKLRFAYTEYHKPYLLAPLSIPSVQFNLAHSHDIAVYAITLHPAIGIDIEKIQNTYHPALTKRFFSPQENLNLQHLPNENERILSVYRLWSRKEALVKAIGKGLMLPLASFTLASGDTYEDIIIEGNTWSIAPLPLHPGYACALASSQPIKTFSHWQFLFDDKHK